MTLPATHFEIHLPVEVEGESAVSLLSAASGLSKQRTKQLMQNGAVWLSHGVGDSQNQNTRRLRRFQHKLVIGDELHLYYDEAIQSTIPGTPHLIAYEGSYSVWFKPQGMYSQGTKWGDHCTINRWVERHLERPTFIVHRLDKAATGLIVLAHKKRTAAALSELFAQRLIDKRYRALVHGQFAAEPVLLDQDIDDRHARSRVTLIHYNAQYDSSLVEVDIETGRKHQIRRHLASTGHAIIGDRLYGPADTGSGAYPGVDLQLMSAKLVFKNPDDGKQKSYSAPTELIPAPMSSY